MSHSREALARAGRGRLRYRAEPAWMPPMLATLSDQPPPTGGGYLAARAARGVRPEGTGL